MNPVLATFAISLSRNLKPCANGGHVVVVPVRDGKCLGLATPLPNGWAVLGIAGNVNSSTGWFDVQLDAYDPNQAYGDYQRVTVTGTVGVIYTWPSGDDGQHFIPVVFPVVP